MSYSTLPRVGLAAPPIALPIMILAAVLLFAAGAVRAAAPGAPAADATPFSSELQGHIEREVMQSLEGLQELGKLAELEALEHLDELKHLADSDRLDAMIAAAKADASSASARYAERYSSDSSGPVIDETRGLKSNGRVSVNNVAGIIEVTTWDRNEVSIGGRLGSSDDKLEISGDSNELNLVVRLPKKSRNGHDTVLELRVPTNARVELETVSADVVVNGSKGPVKVNTVSGDIALALASSEVSVQTVSGDVKLKAPSTNTRLNSISGDLDLEGLSGQLSLETVSGNIELRRGGKFSDLKLKSVSGDLRLDVALTDSAQVGGQTLSGEITMIVPQALSGTALLKSFSGDVHCEGATTVENHSSKKREYVWGDGRGARIELSSFSGDIRVERK
ncbi:DUF4097 family beta strand repeat-containing protein [Nevskia ramosa]|uniref:DUF4097 family beta strand repeat-containing protein n=1 Tax=Nevskia ramosa TaxID=64002 RepID=UPI00146E010A|nr:DUF4097 family beta strand repeat-containing protein [Nevskia ramosa]